MMTTKKNPIFIVGPCVIESYSIMLEIADELRRIEEKHGIQVIYKASYDKANRTSISSYRGPGIYKGLEVLADIKSKYGFRITTDIHESWQAEIVSQVTDVIQIPAFLSRQTDLLVAAAKTNKIVNIKKAQFMSAEDMEFPVKKIIDSGNTNIWLTERGNIYGYNNLIVDFRNIPIMKQFTNTVIMDCTHSSQRPSALNGVSGGDRKFISSIALAAKAFGADGYFFEVHPCPESALCDAACMLPLSLLDNIVTYLIHE